LTFNDSKDVPFGVIKIFTLKPSKFDTEMDLEIFDWKILSTGNA